MVKADLTKELILLTSADLRQRFRKKLPFPGTGWYTGAITFRFSSRASTSGQVLAQVQIHHADGRDHTGQGDTVDLTGSGNHGQAILNSVSIDLEHVVTASHHRHRPSVGALAP